MTFDLPLFGLWPISEPWRWESSPSRPVALLQSRYFSVNSWMIVNISYDRYLSSRTVVDFGSCEVFSMVFV